MRVTLIAMAVAVFLSLPVAAQDRSAEIENTIRGQISAFQADDFDTAFGFASTGIQMMFGTADRFGTMVQQGYPMVHRPADVTFLGVESQGATQLQNVLIKDQSGAQHVLEYQMIETEEGWKINGVRLVPPPQVAV